MVRLDRYSREYGMTMLAVTSLYDDVYRYMISFDIELDAVKNG